MWLAGCRLLRCFPLPGQHAESVAVPVLLTGRKTSGKYAPAAPLHCGTTSKSLKNK